jgi:hypothetical protein
MNEESRDSGVSLAKITSIVFHPLFMPLYGMLIVFSAPTLFGYLPFPVKRLLFIVILINNVILPVSLMPFLKYRKIITSWSIGDRRERIIPLMITTLLYSSTSIIIHRFPVPVFIKSFIIAAFFLSLAVTVITFWWKISIHSVGAGALIGLVLILSFRMYTPLVWYLVSTVVIGGMLLSSRLSLNMHSPQQVWGGFVTGLAGLFLIMFLF